MNNKKVIIDDVLNANDETERNEMYGKYVKNITPEHKWYINMFKAFFAGGIVCVIGQGLTDIYGYFGTGKETAVLYSTLSLILLSVILTGAGAFARIAKFAGAGVLVPITGFANSVAAPAIEFKKEGQVFGIGCKIFTIAGPVILYGIFTSWVLGLLYWIGKTSEIFN